MSSPENLEYVVKLRDMEGRTGESHDFRDTPSSSRTKFPALNLGGRDSLANVFGG